MNTPNDPQLLISRHLNGTITPTEFSVLCDWVMQSPANAREVALAAMMHRWLIDRLKGARLENTEDLNDAMIMPALRLPVEEGEGEADQEPAAPQIVGGSQAMPRRFPRRFPWRMAAAILLPLVLAVAAGGLFHLKAPAATLAASVDAQWDPASAQPTPGMRLATNTLDLNSGLAEVRFASGAVMIVQGPARFRIRSNNAVDLDAGRLTAVVPAGAHGFAVHTPSATAVDLGTEFGVVVSDDRSTRIEVFRGKVEARPLHPADAASAVQVMTVGQAADVTADSNLVTDVPAQPGQFVRQEEFDARAAAIAGSPYQRWLAYSYQLRRDPNLVAYYTFDNAADAPDRLLNRSLLGTALDGTMGEDGPKSKPLWTIGRWPQKGALAFVVANFSHVIVHSGIGDPLDFSRGDKTATPFTIAEWVRVDVHPDDYAAIVAKGFAFQEQFGMQTTASLQPHGWVRKYGDPPNGLECSVEGDSIPVGSWIHLALTYDPSLHSVKLYVNGQLSAHRDDAPEALIQTDLPVTIGARRDSKSNNRTITYLQSFEGRMDELAIFKRSMPADQVREMYQSGKPD
jgi:hypothetical protein